MINLLPNDDRKELRAARTNAILVRYVFFLLIFIALLIAEMFIAYRMIENTKAESQRVIAENEQRTSSYGGVRAEAEAFRENLSIASTILSRQLNYTKVMTDVARLIPTGVVLDQLVIDPSTFGKPITLSARAKSNQAALDLKASLEQSGMFSDVNFQTLSSKPDNASDYPYTATLNAVFNPGVNNG